MPAIVARHHENRAALVARKVGEREPRQDDAAEREHLPGLPHQVSVDVEVWLLGQPVERTAGLRLGRHGQVPVADHLHQHMHPRVRGDAAADLLGWSCSCLSWSAYGVTHGSHAQHHADTAMGVLSPNPRNF